MQTRHKWCECTHLENSHQPNYSPKWLTQNVQFFANFMIDLLYNPSAIGVDEYTSLSVGHPCQYELWCKGLMIVLGVLSYSYTQLCSHLILHCSR